MFITQDPVTSRPTVAKMPQPNIAVLWIFVGIGAVVGTCLIGAIIWAYTSKYLQRRRDTDFKWEIYRIRGHAAIFDDVEELKIEYTEDSFAKDTESEYDLFDDVSLKGPLRVVNVTYEEELGGGVEYMRQLCGPGAVLNIPTPPPAHVKKAERVCYYHDVAREVVGDYPCTRPLPQVPLRFVIE
jgi:hypothetical protein